MKWQVRWAAALLALGALALTATACAGGGRAQVQPASDRPTFVWIFSDP